MDVKIKIEDYTGMDAQTLQTKRALLISSKAYFDRTIESAKKRIREARKEITECNIELEKVSTELQKITEAYKHTKEVQYTPVIFVKKRTESMYLGVGKPTYYVRSMWKEYVVYYYEVYNVNVLGMNKGMILITKSTDFTEKSVFNNAIVDALKQYNTTKIHIDNDVTVNTTMLKKNIKNLEII